MAELIPSLNSCIGRMQSGEKRFARRLVSHLEDDYSCWYEMPVGKRQRYSDFIILHPGRGLLLLEVKDWNLESIHSIDHVSATIHTNTGLKTVGNPLEQVRQCAYLVTNRLQQDPQLRQTKGRYKGNLVVPYGYGVVLSNITRSQFDSTDLKEVLPEHQTICKDEMTETVDPEMFQERLWNMFNFRFSQPLSLPQIDRIRWHLFPEVRINGTEQGTLFPAPRDSDDLETLVPDVVEVMDKQQEQLARNLGEGHRVVHGVAGSGKTLILCYRCIALAEHSPKPILVLCYNITLAARLREMMVERGLDGKVNIYHFHDWCGEQLRLYNLPRPTFGNNYIQELVEKVIEAVDSEEIPSVQYGAVMVDEGHDFEQSWLKLIVAMVDPETNNFLLLYDDAQSIYNKKNHLDFTLSSVGISARGRTSILKLNYRNTKQILNFAQDFISQYMSLGSKLDEDIPLIHAEAIGKYGPEPVLKILDSFDQEAEYVANELRKLHDVQSVPWSNMCITYRSKWMGNALKNELLKNSVPCQLLANAKDKKNIKTSDESVKLMTMHSSKGLEFPVVAVSGVGRMPTAKKESATEAKLLYVAMTRSTDKLLLTADRNSEFVDALSAR